MNIKIQEIANNLRTQDNQMTANPMYCVQILQRDSGYDAAYIGNRCWVDYGNDEIIYDDDKDIKDPGESRWSGPFGYVDRWETVMVCFTESGAKEYIERERNYHLNRAFRGQIRIFVGSFNDCSEMLAIRDFLMKEGKNE